MSKTILVGIASYRDVDLINTVRSAYNNASDPSRIYFSVVSQDEEKMHADLSFIPKQNLFYQKYHWSQSRGACWARSKANKIADSALFDYFLQIDSHSRFDKDWDSAIIGMYEKSLAHWGEHIMSAFPNPFEIDPETNKDIYPKGYGYVPAKRALSWSEIDEMVQVVDSGDQINLEYGDEVYVISAGSLFCSTKTIEEIPYDPEIYFNGEETSIAIRAYTRGIRIVCTPRNYMYSNYTEYPKRPRHWTNHGDWGDLEKESYERLKRILTGDRSLGIFGVGSLELFKIYQYKTSINFLEKFNVEDPNKDL
jgi:hypothetical protein